MMLKFCSTKLKDFGSVQDYANAILTSAHMLNNMALKVDDEWTGSILLAGLEEDFNTI